MSQKLIDYAKESNTTMWIDESCVGLAAYDFKFRELEKKLAKILVENTKSYNEKFELADELQRHFMIKLTVSILGENLINWINCFDLKDPPPPKPPKVRENAEDGEENDEEEEEEEEVDEEEEEELEGDEDSETLKNLKPRTNVDSITDVYHNDSDFCLKIMGGHYLENMEFFNQNPKVIINPDDLDFSFLKEL